MYSVYLFAYSGVGVVMMVMVMVPTVVTLADYDQVKPNCQGFDRCQVPSIFITHSRVLSNNTYTVMWS